MPLLLELSTVFVRVTAIASVGNNPNRTMNLIYEMPRSIIEDNTLNAQLRRAKSPRGKRDDDNSRNEERSDLDSLRPESH
jgi:hypothetical protein